MNGGEATLLQSCFSPGVIGLDSSGNAYVRDARYDSCSRNVYRYDSIRDAVVLSRIRDHFICKDYSFHLIHLNKMNTFCFILLYLSLIFL